MKKSKTYTGAAWRVSPDLNVSCTLVFALMDHPAAADLLRASIGCTILIPVLLYGFLLVYRLLSHDQDNEEER